MLQTNLYVDTKPASFFTSSQQYVEPRSEYKKEFSWKLSKTNKSHFNPAVPHF